MPTEVMCIPLHYSGLSPGSRTCLPASQTVAAKYLSGGDQGPFNALLPSLPRGQLKGAKQYSTVGAILNCVSFPVFKFSRKYLGCHQFL